MRSILISVMAPVTLLTLMPLPAPAEAPVDDTPWWQKKKIVFMWGQWNYARVDKSVDYWIGELPREHFRHVARAGGTVFAEAVGMVKGHAWRPAHARYAHEFGLKYFATRYVGLPRYRVGPDDSGRPWVSDRGEEPGGQYNCTLEQPRYDKWMIEPLMEGIKEGLIDGIFVDWENYGGNHEAGICYCDDCFTKFLKFKESDAELPDKAGRTPWLEEHSLVLAYKQNFHDRRFQMFTAIREKLHAANPDLLFASYDVLRRSHPAGHGLYAPSWDYVRAMHTPRNPHLVLDPSHYGSDDRQPWWQGYSARLRRDGIHYIPGGWTNALFGAQASQVSAARWIYEASINQNGCWLWFERELDDEILRGYAAADRQIKTVEHKLGRFLFQGERDPHFVTTVEWTGRPELAEAMISHSYHLGDEHLVHVNNVDAHWPLRVRVRIPPRYAIPPADGNLRGLINQGWKPKIAIGGLYSVRDALSDLYYTRDGTTPLWTADQLNRGVVVAMEPRSDQFLLVAPAAADMEVNPSQLVHTREFGVLPDHGTASSNAGPVAKMVQLYVMRNSIHSAKLDALLSSTQKVFDLPADGWYFKMDKEDVGAGGKWYLPESPLDSWTQLPIGRFWDSAGGTGAGWYRRDIEVPAFASNQRVYLHFGAVDEQLVLWIDGVYAGDYDREPNEGWDQPFAIDVTGKLTAGRHHLALRVHNSGLNGGIWKPINVVVGPSDSATASLGGAAALQTSSGRLVCTMTVRMGFGGAEGGLTIGNGIHTVDASGASGLRLRQLRGHLWSPSYSPDGERIVFVHDAGGRGQIHVMNEDGSSVVNVSNNSYCDRTPTWSPDGTRIAFVSEREGDWDIFVMNADGSSQQKAAGNIGFDRAPAWSPDGTRLAWESHVAGMPTIFVCDSNGSNSRPLIDPQSKTLRYEVVEEWATDAPVTVRKIERTFPDEFHYLTDPVWSPDGRRIAAVKGGRGGYRGSLVVAEADGSSMMHVNQEHVACSGNLIWSPDGTRLAGTYRAPVESERAGIFVFRGDRETKRLDLVEAVPQGPRLGGAKRHGLMTWYTHGSALPSRVVKTFTSLVWSRDGETLAFSSDIDPSGAFYVFTVRAEGGKPHRLDLTRSAWPNEIAWRPR